MAAEHAMGANFIDTAECRANGESERHLRIALGPRRRDFVMATKTGARNLPDVRLSLQAVTTHIDASLKRMQTDWIDV
jgi:aryl-alcohol dehydrogenase-like predicted oxidoreductase